VLKQSARGLIREEEVGGLCVMLLRPQSSYDQNTGDFILTVDKQTQIIEVGKAAHYGEDIKFSITSYRHSFYNILCKGICSSLRRDGRPCTMVISIDSIDVTLL
jgi:hypothetical protein